MHVHKKTDESKTINQWNKLGFKLKSDAVGECYWTNCYCGHSAYYYKRDEVEEMNENDIKEYKNKIKKIKKEQYLDRKMREQEEFFNYGKLEGIEEGKKEQFLKDLKNFGFKLAMVEVNVNKEYDIYNYNTRSECRTYIKNSKNIYIIPNNIPVGYIGKFPYGKYILEGEVLDFEEYKDKIKDCYYESWFPTKVKKMIE